MKIKLSDQEIKITEYLSLRNGKNVSWEELVQFAKDPSNVKLKTIKKVVSEVKRKYRDAGFPTPFKVEFVSLQSVDPVPKEQKLIQIQIARPFEARPVLVPPAQKDFELDRNTKRVKTKFGFKQLNDSEWEVFKYIHLNTGRIIPISELRDKVVYPLYGSKLPARWFDSIMRIINNLRRQVDGLGNRLLTVKADETSYLFQ